MKLTSLVASSLALMPLVSSQSGSSHIVFPLPGSKIRAGKNFTVQVAFEDTNSSEEQLTLLIGLFHTCSTRKECNLNDNTFLEEILYQGPYTPTQHLGSSQAYENFTVTAPSFLGKGPAALMLANFYLVGASHLPVLTVNNVSVQIVPPK